MIYGSGFRVFGFWVQGSECLVSDSVLDILVFSRSDTRSLFYGHDLGFEVSSWYLAGQIPGLCFMVMI